jgi:hypothetical protein
MQLHRAILKNDVITHVILKKDALQRIIFKNDAITARHISSAHKIQNIVLFRKFAIFDASSMV